MSEFESQRPPADKPAPEPKAKVRDWFEIQAKFQAAGRPKPRDYSKSRKGK